MAPPRLKNAKIPRELNDIIMHAMAPSVGDRYQRAGELLDDLLAARSHWVGPRSRRRVPVVIAPRPPAGDGETAGEIQSRVRARDGQAPRFCWHCRKPLHARSDRCPFCGELQ